MTRQERIFQAKAFSGKHQNRANRRRAAKQAGIFRYDYVWGELWKRDDLDSKTRRKE